MDSTKFEPAVLHDAVMMNNIIGAKYALQIGSDVNAIDGYGKYPMYYALNLTRCHNDEELFQVLKLVILLITYGADLNMFDNLGRSALYYLLVNDDLRDLEELITTFIEYDCNINLVNSDGENLLHVYLKYGSIDKSIIKLFKKFGGNFNQLSLKRQTPLEVFLDNSNTREMHSCLDLFKHLLSEGATDFRNDVGENAMLLAIKAGQALIVKYLIESNFSKVYDFTKDGSTGLHYAVKFSTGASSILSIMLEYIDVNTTDAFGRTPLHIVVLENVPFAQCTIDKLLQYKANVNAIDIYKMSPLQYAIQNRNTEMIKFLIERGAFPV